MTYLALKAVRMHDFRIQIMTSIFSVLSLIGCGTSEISRIEQDTSKTEPKLLRMADDHGLLSSKIEFYDIFGVDDTKTLYKAVELLAKGRSSFREKQDFNLAKAQLTEGLQLLEPFLCGVKTGGFKELETGAHDFNILAESALKAIIIRTYTMSILGEDARESFYLDCLWRSSAFSETRDKLIEKFYLWTGPERLFDTKEFEWFRNPVDF